MCGFGEGVEEGGCCAVRGGWRTIIQYDIDVVSIVSYEESLR